MIVKIATHHPSPNITELTKQSICNKQFNYLPTTAARTSGSVKERRAKNRYPGGKPTKERKMFE